MSISGDSLELFELGGVLSKHTYAHAHSSVQQRNTWIENGNINSLLV